MCEPEIVIPYWKMKSIPFQDPTCFFFPHQKLKREFDSIKTRKKGFLWKREVISSGHCPPRTLPDVPANKECHLVFAKKIGPAAMFGVREGEEYVNSLSSRVIVYGRRRGGRGVARVPRPFWTPSPRGRNRVWKPSRIFPRSLCQPPPRGGRVESLALTVMSS